MFTFTTIARTTFAVGLALFLLGVAVKSAPAGHCATKCDAVLTGTQVFYPPYGPSVVCAGTTCASFTYYDDWEIDVCTCSGTSGNKDCRDCDESDGECDRDVNQRKYYCDNSTDCAWTDTVLPGEVTDTGHDIEIPCG